MQKGDFTLHSYQDDLDTDPSIVDPMMLEQAENPAKELGIPEEEMKDELRKLDPELSEDARERVEDIDDEGGARNNE